MSAVNKIRTIIVDDEIRIHRGIERMVRSSGDDWEIIGTFINGIEVIEFLKESQTGFDLLITDVKMPEMDGLTLIKVIKDLNLTDSFYSIIVSGYDDFHYLQTAIREGACDYVLKPIDRSYFFELLQKVKNNIYKQRRMADKLTITRQTQLLSEAASLELQDISAMYWIKDFPIGLYQLLYVSTDEFPIKTREYSSNDWGMIVYTFENMIEELVMNFTDSEHQMGWWWKGGPFNYWVLLFHSVKEEDECYLNGENFSGGLRSMIKKHTPFSASIALGAPFEDLSILPEMKKQLQSLIRFRMIYGGNKVYSSRLNDEWVCKEDESFVSSEVKEIVVKLVSMLGRLDMPDLEMELNEFFRYVTNLRSPLEIQLSMNYLMIHMYKVCMENMESGIWLNALDDTFEAIKAESHLHRMKHLAKQIFLKVHKNQLTYQKEHRHDPIVKAKSWIQKNLGHKITIKEISELVYMNPTYFCQYFKRKTGITILDYITDERMEKAKELLLEQDIKVAEVSQLLGYQDTKYFSRLFKQKWGSLPSEFKTSFRRSSKEVTEE